MSWCRLGGSKVRFRLREEHHDIENDRNHLKSIAHNNLIYIYFDICSVLVVIGDIFPMMAIEHDIN